MQTALLRCRHVVFTNMAILFQMTFFIWFWWNLWEGQNHYDGGAFTLPTGPGMKISYIYRDLYTYVYINIYIYIYVCVNTYTYIYVWKYDHLGKCTLHEPPNSPGLGRARARPMSHWDSLGFIWTRWVSLDLTWMHFHSLGLTWSHLVSIGLCGSTRFHLDSCGLLDLISLCLTWIRLDPLDLGGYCIYLKTNRITNQMYGQIKWGWSKAWKSCVWS